VEEYSRMMDTNATASTKEKEGRQELNLETPRVLTLNVIPSLTQGLDASDLLECYALVRSAPLHGIANSTISIQKMVLGIRFRPKLGDMTLHVKRPMELTLEYGPQPVGARLNHEAIPVVQVEDSTSYLAWDNVGRVYFTRKLVKENFLSSYYMASMTGAVLDELLTAAVEYSEKRKVYQPFAVFSEGKGRQLRSSSSSDFTWFIWSHLAKLGVEIDPILSPPVYEVRLWVKSMTKVTPEPDIAHQAASFYQKLYNCLEAIATNNYGSFVAPESKTVSALPSQVPSLKPSPRPVSTNKPTPTVNPAGSPRKMKNDGKAKNNTLNTHGDDERGGRKNENSLNGTMRHHLEDVQYDDEFIDYPERDKEDDEPSRPDLTKDWSSQSGSDLLPGNSTSSLEGEGALTTFSPSLSLDSIPSTAWSAFPSHVPTLPTTFPTVAPTEIDDDIEDAPTPDEPKPAIDGSGQGVEKTKQAADDAQKAADQAKIVAETEGDTKAADAAQAAASAAHAAAAATSEAAARAAMDSLLSRDGAMMSSIVSTCFTNPRFDIASIDGNGSISVDAYLYRDYSYYYKLELTSPYVEVAILNRQLPKATVLSGNGSGGDTVDWILALSVVFLVCFMVLLICQQMGYHHVSAVLKCQRWFFNPRKYDYEGDRIAGGESGPMFFFGQDGIPVSMGGRKSMYSPLRQRETITDIMEDGTVADDLQLPPLHAPKERSQDSSGEFEMTSMCKSSPSLHLKASHSSMSLGSNDEVESFNGVSPVPERLRRNTDLVDMPNLKSSSKIAVPAGSYQSGPLHRQRSTSFESLGSDESFSDTIPTLKKRMRRISSKVSSA
jgi:hypothetical protein